MTGYEKAKKLHSKPFSYSFSLGVPELSSFVPSVLLSLSGRRWSDYIGFA